MPSSSSKWPSKIKKSRQRTSFPHSTKGYYQNRAFELDCLCSPVSYCSRSPTADPLGAGGLDGGQCPWDAAHNTSQGGGPSFLLSRKLSNLVWVTNPAMYWVFESWLQSRGYFIVTKPPHKIWKLPPGGCLTPPCAASQLPLCRGNNHLFFIFPYNQ